jgi:hypothetical protein
VPLALLGLTDGVGHGAIRILLDPSLLSPATIEIRQPRRKCPMAQTDRSGDRPRSQKHSNDYTAYDRALISAKQEEKLVTFELASGDVITDCTICSVDRFQIEVEHETQAAMRSNYSKQKEWFNKALILRTRIQ